MVIVAVKVSGGYKVTTEDNYNAYYTDCNSVFKIQCDNRQELFDIVINTFKNVSKIIII